MKSKSKSKNEPWAPAAPYILKSMEQSQRVFDQQQPDLDRYSGMQRDSYGKLAPGAEQGIMGAQGVVNSTLAGDNLNGNPYLDAMLAATRGNTITAVDSQFSRAGRYGSGNHAGILAKAIAEAENGARFQNYGMERQNQLNAVGQASGLMGGSQSLLNNAAELPWIGVGALNGNIRQASNGYGTQTGTQSGGFGQALMGAAMGGLNAYAANPSAFKGMFGSGGGGGASFTGLSDRRVKDGIELLERLSDGLGVYEWTYRQDTPFNLPTERQRGVMADEVAALRPWALGEPLSGYATVRYDLLEKAA